MGYRFVFVNEEGVVTGTRDLPEGTDAAMATELAFGLLEGGTIEIWEHGKQVYVLRSPRRPDS
jgi:hypothetical protein